MKWFTIEELCRSATAQELGIKNEPTTEIKNNLENLVVNVLDPAREAMNVPIIVNSGYRCHELNKAVGGASNSQHLKGEAADITVGSKEGNKRLFEYIRDNLPYDQLIDEYNYSWIHVSLDVDMCNRREIIHKR